MIVIKYQKKDSSQFISHIDLLKHMARIIRRADIPVKYSQGFNPHTLVYFSPPSVLGVASDAEYVTIDTDMDKDEVLNRFNNSVSESLKGIKVFKVLKDPKLQANVVAGDFVFPVDYTNLDVSNFVIKYTKKGEEFSEDVTDKIFAVENYNGKLLLRLLQGNTSLRPDRIIGELNARLNADINLLDVTKVRQYVKVDNKLVDVDEWLK